MRMGDYSQTNRPQNVQIVSKGLAAKNPEAAEAKLLRARAATLRSSWSDAISILEPMIATTPTAVTFSLMADAVGGLYGAERARPWLERAANAPRDPRPGGDGDFHFTRDGWASLVREFMEHERLSAPPLEETIFAISSDEVRLLLAPPPERNASRSRANGR